MRDDDLIQIVKLMEFACYGFAVLLALTGAAVSAAQKRLHPVLLLCIGTLSIFWIESPFDWATYASFHPGMQRLPDWGPWHTWGGLPAFAPFGYVMYFTLPTLLTIFLARRTSRLFSWRLPLNLWHSIISPFMPASTASRGRCLI